MLKSLIRRHAAPGTAPGTLRPPAERKVDEVRMRLLHYGPWGCEERELASVAEVEAARRAALGGEPGVFWLDVVGLHDVELLAAIGRVFGLHALALEDVANVGQRPKVEEYDDHLFVVVRGFHEDGDELEPEQLALFLLPDVVLSFQERPGDAFDPVRERVRRGKGRARGMGADYLLYALIDAVIDGFFPLLEAFGERIEDLEAELIEDPSPATLERIYQIRRELLQLRRAAWPEREVVNSLHREETPHVTRETKVFLRDCYDHAVEVLEILETYRELAGSMLDVYLLSLSHRMNEVMKVLTIIATIFIPLTFIAGVYGMNFERMPELRWAWGYPAALGVMAAIGITLALLFKRRGWF